MIDMRRYACIVISLGLLVAGCSRNQRAGSQSIARSAAISGQNTTSGHSGHNRLANTAASDMRYDITLNEIRELVRAKSAVIIDAREPSDYANGHVRGALNMPAAEKEAYLKQISRLVAPNQLIVIYCSGPHCDWGDEVYDYLARHGFINMRVFKPGWQAIASADGLR